MVGLWQISLDLAGVLPLRIDDRRGDAVRMSRAAAADFTFIIAILSWLW